LRISTGTEARSNTSQYTYYTVSALGVRVPQALKRTLTTAQISQFLMGFAFASFHLFVSYTVPVSTPYTITRKVLSEVASAASAATSVVSEVAEPTVSAGLVAFLKKIALRAAGEEGLAENVPNAQGEPFGSPAPAVVQAVEQYWENVNETSYRDEWHTVSCIDTTGQSFAIWLNLVYLLPLTWLFVRFFIRSYTRRTSVGVKSKGRSKAKSPASTRRLAVDTAVNAKNAAKDAAKGVENQVEKVGKTLEKEADHIIEGGEQLQKQRSHSPSTVRELAGNIERRIQKAYEHSNTSSPERSSSPADRSVRKVRSQSKLVQEKANQILSNGKAGAEEVATRLFTTIEEAEKKGQELAEKVMKGGWEPKRRVDESWDLLDKKPGESQVFDTPSKKSVVDVTTEKAESLTNGVNGNVSHENANEAKTPEKVDEPTKEEKAEPEAEVEQSVEQKETLQQTNGKPVSNNDEKPAQNGSAHPIKKEDEDEQQETKLEEEKSQEEEKQDDKSVDETVADILERPDH